MLMNFGDDGSYVPTDENGEEVAVPTYWVTAADEEDEWGWEDPYEDSFDDDRDYRDPYDYYEEESRYDDYEDRYDEDDRDYKDEYYEDGLD